MGYSDGNGFWVTEETDLAAPVSDLFNAVSAPASIKYGLLSAQIATILSNDSASPDPYAGSLKGLTSDPALGTGGTYTSYFKYLARVMTGFITVKFGTASVSAGSGLYYLTLPAVPWDGDQIIGHGVLYDSSANTRFSCALGWNGNNAFITADNQTAEWGSAGAPFVPAANDFLRMQVSYLTAV